MATMLTVYTLATCDSCRKAVKWLKAHHIAFEERAIRETPPSAGELEAALKAYAGVVRKLFNTGGRDYRDQNIAEQLPEMTPAAAVALLTKNGNLVKRPLVIGPGVALVGFNEAEWSAALRR